MTLAADTATPARTNGQGDPCPPWCVTDHAKYSFHGAENAVGYAPEFHRWSIRAVRFPVERDPHIQVAAAGVVSVPLHDAGGLAAIIEDLAGATPGQLRQLAAAIRQAAAQITEAGQ
jgi:hypothetical protein